MKIRAYFTYNNSPSQALMVRKYKNDTHIHDRIMYGFFLLDFNCYDYSVYGNVCLRRFRKFQKNCEKIKWK